MIFRPDIKPPMWGSPDAVRYAVRANCEEMGVDYNDFALIMPMWNSGNQYDYSKKALVGINNGAIYTQGNLKFDGTAYVEFGTLLTSNQDITVFADIIVEGSSIQFVVCQAQSRDYFKPHWGAGINNLEYDQRSHDVFANITYNTNTINPLFTLNEKTTICWTFAVNNIISYFTNGIKDEITAAIGSASTYGTGTFVIGGQKQNSTTFNYGFTGRIFNLLIYQGILLQDQISLLNAQPYRLLMPVSRPVYFGAGSAPSTSYSLTDTGHGSDLVFVSANLSVSDAGAGTDSFGSLAADIPVTDQGIAVETVNPIISLSVSDVGSAVDSISQIINALLVQDTSSAVDSISQIIASLIVSDSGSGVEINNISKGNIKTIIDAGSASDSISVPSVSLSVSDSGLATDLINSITAALSVYDTGASTDLINSLVSLSVTDFGTGSDMVSMSVSLTVADMATAIDSISKILTSLSVSETGTGSDTIIKTDFSLLPEGEVKITLSMKIPTIIFTIN